MATPGATGQLIMSTGHVGKVLNRLLGMGPLDYLTFDIETAQLAGAQVPLGISSVSFGTPQVGKAGYHRRRHLTVHGAMAEKGFKAPGKTPAVLSRVEAGDVLRTLRELQRRGTKIVGYNIAGFDIPRLMEESGLYDEGIELALKSYDPMLQTQAKTGVRAGLSNILKQLGIQGKGSIVRRLDDPKEYTGKQAVADWATGITDNLRKVLGYSKGDVKVTSLMWEALTKRQIPRGSKAFLKESMEDGLLTVEEAWKLAQEGKGNAWAAKAESTLRGGGWDSPQSKLARLRRGAYTEELDEPLWGFDRVTSPRAKPAGITNTLGSMIRFMSGDRPDYSGAAEAAPGIGKRFLELASKNKGLFIGAGLGAATLIGIGHFFGGGTETTPEGTPWFPQTPMRDPEIEAQTLMGLGEPIYEGMRTIGDFSKSHKARFAQGKGGLVQWLWENRNNGGQCYYLGNGTPPARPARSTGVRSRAGVQ